MASRAALLAVLVALSAGCVTLGGQSAAPETVTPAPVPEQTPGEDGRPLVPGLASERLVDADALAAAHVNGVQNRSYTLRIDWDSAGQERQTLVRVESERRYSYRSQTGTGGYGDQSFVQAQTRYSRHERPLGVEYVRGEAVPAHERVSSITGHLVGTFLGVGNSSVSVVDADDGRYYRVTTSHPNPSALNQVRDFRARAVVEPSGLVRSMELAFRNPRQNTTVRYGFEYTAVDETTVERPAWVIRHWPNATVDDRQHVSDNG